MKFEIIKKNFSRMIVDKICRFFALAINHHKSVCVYSVNMSCMSDFSIDIVDLDSTSLKWTNKSIDIEGLDPLSVKKI